MTNELLNYRQILDSVLNSGQSGINSTDSIKADIRLESTRILKALHDNILYLNPLKAQYYITHHQQSLTLLLNDIHSLAVAAEQEDQNKKNVKALIELLTVTSENLLFDLQKYFPDYFNRHHIVPWPLCEKTNLKIKAKTSHLADIVNRDDSKKEFKEILVNVIIPILIELKTFTYEQQNYLEHFLDKLTSETEKEKAPGKIIDILLVLISLNFNHSDFYQYCFRYFSQEIDKCEDLATQHRTLSILKKCIRQTFHQTDQRYTPGLPPIKESLLTYIESELDYLSSMNNIGARLNQHGLLDNKYKVTFTVKQLAIFIHLQVEAKIIIPESAKLLHQYISDHYSTNDTDRISAKSFKNAYYSASTEDLEKVIDKIVTMLAVAQEKL
jgi:hypothetical protein